MKVRGIKRRGFLYMLDGFSFWEIFARTIVTFAILLFLARIMGKKQIGQLTFFNYVTGITIGSIAAELVAHDDTHYLNATTALILWAILTLLVSYVSTKSSKVKELLDDKPSIVIKDGKIIEKELKSNRIPVTDLTMLLRLQGVFSVKDVHFAVLETNGELSIFKKVAQQPATKQDVKAPVAEPKYMPSTLIADGIIIQKNLLGLNLTEEWLIKELKKSGINSANQVFYAQIDSDGSVYFDLKDADL